MWKILVIDDEPREHALLSLMLPAEFEVVSCFTGNEALSTFARKKPDLILLDMLLPDMSGLDFMRAMKNDEPNPPLIMISSCNDTSLVVEAVKAGADEFIVKPYTYERLFASIRRLLSAIRGRREIFVTREEAEAWGLIGESAAMRRIKHQVKSFAGSDSTVLITGESGTGKEVVAQALHRSSRRAMGPFRALNCAAVPEQLFESEMFGSDKGAFTGATTRQGVLEGSEGGSLLLDEIGELPKALQVKLLRVLEEKTIRHLGSFRSIGIDVRVIAATNRDLKTAVAEGMFRRDLYYRLNVFHIRIPPLRERREDLPILAYYFLQNLMSGEAEDRRLSTPSLRKLMEYSWPGNIRELKNVMERAYHVAPERVITPESIQFD